VLVAKLDTDRSQRTAQGFNIRGIPTTIVFKSGKEAARQTGAVPKKGLEDLLNRA
jgi:thioredoxin-like negative regulator of GroEL